jgi:hypothetical protein
MSKIWATMNQQLNVKPSISHKDSFAPEYNRNLSAFSVNKGVKTG